MSDSKHFLISDIDNTLVGGESKWISELNQLIAKKSEVLSFGVATGRTIDLAVEILKRNNVAQPEVLITSVGAEIHYGAELIPDHSWTDKINIDWNRDAIFDSVQDFDFLTPQPDNCQRPFKVSFFMKPNQKQVQQVRDKLNREGFCFNAIYSNNRFLDLLPRGVSKGKAIEHVAEKLKFPLENFFVSGDSGNDEEMLNLPHTKGIVVGNYLQELEHLKGCKGVYFCKKFYAEGILEGLAHYDARFAM